jgi:drug/metabolite transporter (DMT)-like permease
MTRAQVLALTAIIMWSTAASAFKVSLRFGSPFSILFVATLVSLVVCLVSVLAERVRRGVRMELDGRTLAGAAVRGLLNPVAYYLVLLEAYHRLLAQTAMVINYLWPVMLVLLAVPVLGQKLRLPVLGAVLVSFSGVAVMALGGGGGEGDILGDLPAAGLALASTVIWALYWLLNVRDPRPGNQKLLLNLCFGAVYMVAWGFLTGAFALFPPEVIVGGVYIGVFEMGLAYLLWMKALTLAETTAEVGNLVFLTPFIALVLVGLVVGERIGVPTVAGLGLVVAGIFLQRRFRREPAQKRS